MIKKSIHQRITDNILRTKRVLNVFSLVLYFSASAATIVLNLKVQDILYSVIFVVVFFVIVRQVSFMFLAALITHKTGLHLPDLMEYIKKNPLGISEMLGKTLKRSPFEPYESEDDYPHFILMNEERQKHANPQRVK